MYIEEEQPVATKYQEGAVSYNDLRGDFEGYIFMAFLWVITDKYHF